jgi:hypothetical protein
LPLSLADVRLLLPAARPQPVLEVPHVLSLLAYQHQREAAAYRSHRKRLLAHLHHLARPGWRRQSLVVVITHTHSRLAC